MTRILYAFSPMTRILYAFSPMTRILYAFSPMTRILYIFSPMSLTRILDAFRHMTRTLDAFNPITRILDVFSRMTRILDTTLFCNFDTTCNSEKINSELEKIYRWLCSNKLSLNVGKTKFACFHTAQRIVAYLELKINNFIIDRVTEFNFLGLIISSNMKWKKHIDHIALKVSKIIGIMYRLKFILPAYVLLTIYNSLILPHFNYCHLAWGSNITAGHKLHLLQKKAVRIVDHRHFIAHTEPICKRLRIVKIVGMFKFQYRNFIVN